MANDGGRAIKHPQCCLREARRWQDAPISTLPCFTFLYMCYTPVYGCRGLHCLRYRSLLTSGVLYLFG